MEQFHSVNPVVSYEVCDSQDEYVVSYSFDLKKNTNGKLDPLKMAKDAVKHKADYRLYEVYANGHRKLIEF